MASLRREIIQGVPLWKSRCSLAPRWQEREEVRPPVPIQVSHSDSPAGKGSKVDPLERMIGVDRVNKFDSRRFRGERGEEGFGWGASGAEWEGFRCSSSCKEPR